MSKRVDTRAAARLVREQIAKEKRRKRTIWISAGVVLALALGGLVGWGVYASNKPTTWSTPAGANAEGTGVAAGTGPIVIEEYVDYLCSHCKTFHDDASGTIAQLVQAGAVTVVTHPVAYLDSGANAKYSTRTSAASACAADAGKFAEYSDVLFANQPSNDQNVPSDADLIAFGQQVGLGDNFAQCVRDKTYVTWAGHVTTEAAKANVKGTPAVFVAGKAVNANAAEILAAVTAATPSGAASADPSTS